MYAVLAYVWSVQANNSIYVYVDLRHMCPKSNQTRGDYIQQYFVFLMYVIIRRRQIHFRNIKLI